MPETAAEILSRLGQPDALEAGHLPDLADWGGVRAGATTTKGAPLFPRIEAPVDGATAGETSK
ncbi:MAG: hypothetical protein HC814_07865 [Rhodobacteraceae bacterium]|nr:hypothetical protein [Paracoccaceae bacterium]